MPTRQPIPETRAAPHVFSFGPFLFTSEIDIPELRDTHASGPNRRLVTIRLGDVPSSIAGAARYGSFCQLTSTEYLLDIPDTARYYVRDGNQVRVDFAPGTPIANITTYLLGSIFGALCHQNGLLPLHASAVEHHGNVIAFLGDSGAGKSTLAACVQRRGHRIVSDDICLLEPATSPTGPLPVIPVAGWLKLWNQSLQYLGETPNEQHRVFSTDDKFRLYLPAEDAAATSPSRHLARAVFLAKATDPAAEPALERLAPPEAIAGLMDMVYSAYVPALTGNDARAFHQCARVFQYAQAFRLTMPWGLDRIDSVLDLLEREIFDPVCTPPPAPGL